MNSGRVYFFSVLSPSGRQNQERRQVTMRVVPLRCGCWTTHRHFRSLWAMQNGSWHVRTRYLTVCNGGGSPRLCFCAGLEGVAGGVPEISGEEGTAPAVAGPVLLQPPGPNELRSPCLRYDPQLVVRAALAPDQMHSTARCCGNPSGGAGAGPGLSQQASARNTYIDAIDRRRHPRHRSRPQLRAELGATRPEPWLRRGSGPVIRHRSRPPMRAGPGATRSGRALCRPLGPQASGRVGLSVELIRLRLVGGPCPPAYASGCYALPCSMV
jgi:hypothetical protein